MSSLKASAVLVCMFTSALAQPEDNQAIFQSKILPVLTRKLRFVP